MNIVSRTTTISQKNKKDKKLQLSTTIVVWDFENNGRSDESIISCGITGSSLILKSNEDSSLTTETHHQAFSRHKKSI